MQYGTLLPMGKVFYLSQVVAHQKELLSNKICDITPTQTIPHEKPGVEDAYHFWPTIEEDIFIKIKLLFFTVQKSSSLKQ